MPKFNFRMQGYLNLKSKMEDQRKLEYGQAVSELERERAKLKLLEAQRAETISAFREEGQKAQTAGLYNNYLTWLKEAIGIQTESVRKAEAEAERRRAALTEAMKERKMLETLKEKHYVDFIREQNLTEQKNVDEVVSFRQSSREY